MRALAGDGTTAGQGWNTDLSPSMGGVLTQTVSYTDSSGTRWLFPYFGNTAGSGPFSQYDIPPGQPWALSTSPITGYTLANILTGESMTFDAQGRLQQDTDAYSNTNTLTYGASGPTSEANSGDRQGHGRALTFTYNGAGQLADAQSSLWQSQGASASGSQHVTYGYNPQGQLTTLTRGAGTTDALTTTFGYNGAELVTVTTPYTQSARTWTLGYDPQGRVISVTSPVSGTPGQAGYTPAYTTQITYAVSRTVVVEGFGSTQPLTHTYTLDAQGNATQQIDGLGDTSSTTYDTNHDALTSTDANGNTTTNYYQYVGPTGSTGLITQTNEPAIYPDSPLQGALVTPTITHVYNAANDLVETDLPGGGITFYGYDGAHSVITTTTFVDVQSPGCTTALVASKMGQATTAGDAVATDTFCHYVFRWRASVNRYDQYGERVATTDGRGVSAPNTTSTTSGDPHTALPTVTLDDPSNLYTGHSTYDGQGDETGDGTPVITTTLNGITTTAPVTTSSGYDADGNPISVTSANGHTTIDTYDHLGRLVQTNDPAIVVMGTTPLTPTETTRYDGDGNIVRTTDANDNATASSYDPLGRLVSQTSPVSGTTAMTYTATEQTATQDAQGNVMQDSYDGAGRLTQEDDPASGLTQYQYDPVGNTVAITSGDGSGATQVETRGYDAQDRVVSDTVSGPGAGAAAGTTRTSYDVDGNVAQVEQPNGDVSYSTYYATDQLHTVELDPAPIQPSQATSPKFETYDLDQAGNVVADTDQDSRHTQETLDGDNRVVQSVDTGVTPPMAAITTTTQFDPDGNGVGTTTQSDPGNGVVETHTATTTVNADDEAMARADDGLATGYGLDAVGQAITETLLDGAPLTTSVTAGGAPQAIGESVGGAMAYTTTIGYNRNELPVTLTLPNGVQQVGSYDPHSRLTGLSLAGVSGGSLPSAYSYTYNPLGWVTSAVTTAPDGGTETYTHNALGRLIADARPGIPTEHWDYDQNGNFTRNYESVGGISATTYYTYSATQPNELVQQHTDGHGIEYYQYDNQGNTTSITSTDSVAPYAIDTQLAYDEEGRPITITLRDGSVVTLGYNAQDQRSRYTVTDQHGQVTLDERFRYRGFDLGQVAVTGSSVTQPYTDTYVYGPADEPLELLRQQGGTTSRYWYVLDGLGQIVALTDVHGNVVDQYRYDPWGEIEGASEQVPQQLRYKGYWWDQALGWYWSGQRDYDPEGHFLQPDPSQIDGLRTYVYAGDDPVDYADLDGLGCVPSGGWFANAINGLCDAAGRVGKVVYGAWNLVAGDDIHTVLYDKNPYHKAFALIDLALIFVPGPGEALKAGKVSAELVLKLAARTKILEPVIKSLDRRVLLQALRESRLGRVTLRAVESCAHCFPAGTLVATPGGRMRAIQTLRVGDTVLSEDPTTGKVDAEAVQAVIHDPISPLLAVDLSDGSAITVTADHPFWVDSGLLLKGAGWLEAGHLRRGDRLRTANGQDVTVIGVRWDVGRAPVYTLTVAKDHTFFVGPARVLVHNATCSALRLTKARLIHVLWRHLNASDIAQALARAGKVSASDLASNVANAGQFLSSTTTEELKTLIMDALHEGNRLNAFATQPNGNLVADVDLGRIIGIERDGTPTSVVRIVVKPDGRLWTIFPV